MKSSLEIAQEATLRPIDEIAEEAGLLPEEVDPYGRYKAKIGLGVLDRLSDRPDGKIVCVAGMTPTKAGEGKTTTLVGLTQGLGAIGKKPVACLREPSLGPVFGIKGGAAGGGMTQVVPMEDLNLHFTGDIHAIGAANNLLAAMLDASILHGNPHKIDALRVGWRRALDMNDRAPPGDAMGRQPALVAVEDVAVDERSQHVVGRGDGVEVAGEVEVEVLHRHHLREPAAGGAALDAEDRSQRGLAQAQDRALADRAQALRQRDRGGGLALAGLGGRDRRDAHDLGVRRPRQAVDHAEVDLGLVLAVQIDLVLLQAHLRGDVHDRPQDGFLGDLEAALHLCSFADVSARPRPRRAPTQDRSRRTGPTGTAGSARASCPCRSGRRW